jgi:Fe(II)/alpha-ketoglutarate-dependent arginine beta-hydroxylase
METVTFQSRVARDTATTNLWLTEDEARVMKALAETIAGMHRSTEDQDFLDEATVYAHELPRRVRRVVNDFRLHEPRSAILVVSGYPVDDEKIGNTLTHWKNREERTPTIEEEILLILLGSLLGDCIGWATQQDGRIVHDILPIRGLEHEQLGSGSEELLWWHTEDAFHPYRGDYLGMLCLRNPDRVATTFAPLDGLPLGAEDRRFLAAPLYTIRPDESHLKKNISDPNRIEGELETSYSKIEQMNSTPDKIAILYGDPEAPYIRIDPYFMDPVGEPRAQAALDGLIRWIDSRMEDMVLEAGDFCFIDNFQGMHGRKPFKARYDGKDRWLKRINIVRDLRKSRTARPSPENRVIT